MTKHITHPDQVREIFAKVRAELAAEERAGITPTPPPTNKPEHDPESVEGRQAAAFAAAEAAEKHGRLVVAARELLRSTILPEQGYPADLADADRMTDAEALAAARVVAAEETGHGYELPQLSQKEQATAELERKWFQLSDGQRRERAAELGVSYAEIAERKAADPNPNIFS